ncbi:MAG: N-acetylmuramoyl-L-alanine amidase [Sphingobacteriales bacterium]|nr:N-acetylmuramoyl-L-alanine amidase [Sphingobacteriales bacterium]
MLRLIFFLSVFTYFSAPAQLNVSDTNKFIMGKTAGSLPYLEYGLGEDRLGGAKMTYLDTAVVIKVVDSTIINYKIQLSKNHFAYLPKSNFFRDSTILSKPYYLTNSWLVNGNDSADFVSITLDEKLPYRSIQQINPSRIVVDIFGATSNTNWITQRSTAREIKNAYYEQTEDDVFRIIIELTHSQHWGYSIFYRDKKLIIKIKRQPEHLNLQRLKIAIDAGHGGENDGAKGATTGILEKNYTLLMAKELERELAMQKANVFMTRSKDTSLSMIERTELLKKENPDFLISIHLNSSVRDSIKGVSTYYRYIGFRALSQYILQSMVQLGLNEFGNVGNFNFSLNGPTDYPNCLVEVAFLSNKEDEQLILDPEFHKAVACQIIDGIKRWLDSCK